MPNAAFKTINRYLYKLKADIDDITQGRQLGSKSKNFCHKQLSYFILQNIFRFETNIL